MKRILIVDDDIHIGNLLEELLLAEGYLVSRAYSGSEALLVLKSDRPDLILLDLMLPGVSGEEVLQKVRDIPVIVVSAKVDVESKVGLLFGGAVDYITKPFETRELLARVAVALRKSTAVQDPHEIRASGLVLSLTTHSVKAGETDVHLTRTEYAILKLLMQNKGQVIAKSVLLDRIAEDTPDCTEASLKQHVSNLRRKLRELSGMDHVEAVWGIGFLFK